jgi:GNAT superfamily N-acetyltransferase
VTDEGGGVLELQNLAVAQPCQRQGYGMCMAAHLFAHYSGRGTMLVGTGDSPVTVPFYQRCGFVMSHRAKDYMLHTTTIPSLKMACSCAIKYI